MSNIKTDLEYVLSQLQSAHDDRPQAMKIVRAMCRVRLMLREFDAEEETEDGN